MVPGRLVAHPIEGQEKRRALAFLVLGSGSMCLGSSLLAHILFYPPLPGSPGAGACGRRVGSWKQGSLYPTCLITQVWTV